ncbi:uncharacterized protein si:ch211-67e16.4 isoform X3 [Tachysurus ichikawai]
MDVNLTISLMRGQMGVVIEKAVNTAVETVLGEMIRVMSLKFEQLRREMTAKEKENEDIRKMLESTRCQMKILRQKYVHSLNSKDDRHAFAPHRHTLGQMNTAGPLDPTRQLDTTRHPAGPLDTTRHPAGPLDTTSGHDQTPSWSTGHDQTPSCQLDTAGPLDQTRHTAGSLDTTRAHPVTADHGVLPRRRTSNTGSPCAEPLTLALKPRNSDATPAALPVSKTHKVIHEAVPTESCQNAEIEEVPGIKVHLKVENSSITILESIDPLWGQTPQTSTETEPREIADPNIQPVVRTNEALNSAVADCREPVLQIKEEEAEVEIKVKEEQAEPSTSELPRIELHQHLSGAGMTIELPVTQQCIQIPSVTEPAFLGVDPSTYSESQLAVADTQRLMHPFCKDLMLYEDYKRKRIEVRKRSETRRRELERTLPQALLADLVKERREKTRLRVARWRAKRKLQACLMAQAAQFNSTQAIYTQRNGRRREGPAPQHGGIGFGTAQSETGVYTMPMQMGTSPLLAAQRLGMAEGQTQPGASVFVQQRTSAAGSETYQ